MKLICIFLAATLAVVAAKPYGIKGGYDRDSDRLLQTHIPVTDDINADRAELGNARKIGRPTYGGEASLVEPIGGYRDREAITQVRPISGVHGDHGRITEVGRPIGGGYDGVNVARPIGGGHGQVSEVGRPIGGGYDGVNVARPIGGGYGQVSEVGRPIGGGYGGVNVVRPIGGHGQVSEVGRPIGGGYGGVNVARPIGEYGHNSRLETEELGGYGGGYGGVQQAQQIGGIKSGQHRKVGY